MLGRLFLRAPAVSRGWLFSFGMQPPSGTVAVAGAGVKNLGGWSVVPGRLPLTLGLPYDILIGWLMAAAKGLIGWESGLALGSSRGCDRA